jgi:hypothetical protein
MARFLEVAKQSGQFCGTANEAILDYAIGDKFYVPLLHKIGVQLAHE